jgi:GAF domain-containing protein
LEFSLNVGPIELTGRRLKIGEGLSGQVFASGLTLRVDDYLSWSGHSATFADAPFHSAVCTPLLWQGKVGGVLAVTRSQPDHPFTAEHENLLQIIATQAASALENLRLRAEQQRALDELTALNRQLVSEAWQAESLGEVVQYEYHQAAVDRFQPLGLSLEIPIELRGTPIGTITLQDQTRRELTEDERGLIDGVVQQMALALENQRLATAAQLAAQRDRAIAETADKIHRPTDVEAILRVAVTELTRVTGISGIGVQLGFAPAVQGNGQHDEEAGAQAHD